MRIAAASLAAVLAVALLGCGGGDGAEPGAPAEATLVLDFTPNAVHAGIYTALRREFDEREGVDLEVIEPGASTDAPKLLESGRTEFAILDINDLGIAVERGFELVAVAGIVQRPLASVIARDRNEVRTPADLAGREIGVTGLPSDDAVLDAVLAAGGVEPAAVERITIGFEAVKALAGGRIDAATAFWNAEGVALRRLGVPTREFRVDRYGASRYPELVLVTTRELIRSDPQLVKGVANTIVRGYRVTDSRPFASLDDLLAEQEGLDRPEQRAQMRALAATQAFEPPGRIDPALFGNWYRFAYRGGIVPRRFGVTGFRAMYETRFASLRRGPAN